MSILNFKLGNFSVRVELVDGMESFIIWFKSAPLSLTWDLAELVNNAKLCGHYISQHKHSARIKCNHNIRLIYKRWL